jgi:hypothetical protein
VEEKEMCRPVDRKPCLGSTDEPKRLTPEVVLSEEVGVKASGRDTALARLRAGRTQLKHEWQQAERQIVAARLQVATAKSDARAVLPM